MLFSILGKRPTEGSSEIIFAADFCFYFCSLSSLLPQFLPWLRLDYHFSSKAQTKCSFVTVGKILVCVRSPWLCVQVNRKKTLHWKIARSVLCHLVIFFFPLHFQNFRHLIPRKVAAVWTASFCIHGVFPPTVRAHITDTAFIILRHDCSKSL